MSPALALDTSIHQNPGTAAVLLHWLAKGHEEEHRDDQGILIPWAMLSLGLLQTTGLREGLPKRRNRFSNWIMSPGPRQWIGSSKQIILAWKPVFWHAIGHGIASRVLAVRHGRVYAVGGISATRLSPIGRKTKSMATALGKTFASEDHDHVVAQILGLEFEK